MNLVSVKGRRVCLIGGAGFIGHNLALRLDQLGADVSIVDGLEVNNLSSLAGNADNVPHPELSTGVVQERLRLIKGSSVKLYVQDARDYHALSRLIREIEPEIIVQLAAVSHANRSNKDPYSTFDHSFRTLENALDAARGCSVEHFIIMYSYMVYGIFSGDRVDVETVCEPLGIYGALKLRKDCNRLQLCLRFALHNHSTVSALRRALYQPPRGPNFYRKRHYGEGY